MSLQQVSVTSSLNSDIHFATMGDMDMDNSSNGLSMIEVPYLIVGTGPAGGALAAFMASYGEATLESSGIARKTECAMSRNEGPHC